MTIQHFAIYVASICTTCQFISIRRVAFYLVDIENIIPDTLRIIVIRL